MNQLYRCEICGLPFATVEDLYIHQRHCSNVGFPTSFQPISPGLPSGADVPVQSSAGRPATKGQQFCESCQLSITGSATNLRRHQKTIAHMAVVEAARARSKSPKLAGQSSEQSGAVHPAKDKQWECEICQVSFDTPYALASHRKSLPYKEATNSRLPEAERPLSEEPLREICGPCRSLEQCCTGKVPCGTCEYYRRPCYSQPLSSRDTKGFASAGGPRGPTVEGTLTSPPLFSPEILQLSSSSQGRFQSWTPSSLGTPSTPQMIPLLERPSTSQILPSLQESSTLQSSFLTAQTISSRDSNYPPFLNESNDIPAAESDPAFASRQRVQENLDEVSRPDTVPYPITAAELNSIDMESYHQILDATARVEGMRRTFP